MKDFYRWLLPWVGLVTLLPYSSRLSRLLDKLIASARGDEMTNSDEQKAFHLGITVEAFRARIQELYRQAVIIKSKPYDTKDVTDDNQNSRTEGL
jgi:hypothetical protein